jgi:hypothetical protein
VDQGPSAKAIESASNIMENRVKGDHSPRSMDHYPWFKEEETLFSAHGAWSICEFNNEELKMEGRSIWRLPVLPGFSDTLYYYFFK